MRIHSTSFAHGQPIPEQFALGAVSGFGGNHNPHILWSDAPTDTQSFAIVCIDTDAPTDASLAGKEGVDIPVDHVRGDFIHWVMIDIPPDVNEIAAGSVSHDVQVKGKSTPTGPGKSRQGLNDYTGWFKGNAEMEGNYMGYDGPYPPPNDLRVHRYFFRVFALDVEKLDVPDLFDFKHVMRALHGHVLAEASTYGTYTLNTKAGA